MKKIRWLDTTKEIPNVGIANKNDVIDMPDDVADSFVSQGKAKFEKIKVEEKDNA